MRIPSDEFVPSQIGLTNDPQILYHMNQASKDSPIKGGTGMLVGCLAALAAIIGYVAWCVLF